ncbi:LysE family translocator [Promineifilum sp.]|uniref:LysE family translocator n=1 Tax=Promineifilum sp. TaxID=2664178 RepID=UPI0035B3C2BF
MLSYLLRGLILGATAAAQPGPFQAFLLSLIARNGWRRALPAAFAPLLSDGPILLVVLLVLTRLPERFLSILQMAGGLFLLYLAWGAWRSFRRDPAAGGEAMRGGIVKAALMNALSPSPYIFWATIAGPILIAGWRESPALGLAFVLGFYVAIVGGLALFILAIGAAGRVEPRINRALGAISAVALFAFGLYQLTTGISQI